jgi:hypothetical protein
MIACFTKEILMLLNDGRSAPLQFRERGIALFFAIFALLLLTAITFSLVFLSNTESTVNSNYREEQVAYFAAKAGIEEARARMMASDPNFVTLPITAPTAGGGIIYLINNAGLANAVRPWLATNAYPDDELCHDGYGLAGLNVVAADIRCATEPTSTTYYTTVASTIPYSGTSNALAYRWVRIAPKLNGSVQGPGTTITNTTYNVNASVGTASTLICWDGIKELVLTVANCNAMSNANATYMTNVYMITSLGVSPAGARRMVQAEVALNPTTPFPYGMFAQSNACPAITFSGNNASVDSYTTAAGGTYASTHSNTGGDVGSDGGVGVGNGNIGGIVGVLTPPPGIGTCATPVSIGANGSMAGTVACPTGNAAACYLSQAYTFPTPPTPNPLPPNTSYGGSLSIVPGTYGNISLAGNDTLTMTPGTYTVNSLTMAGNASVVVSPAGAVVLNIAGVGGGTVLAISGNGVNSTSIIPNNFVINYGGTGNVSVSGNGSTTAMIDAPKAALSMVGNGAYYGSLVGGTISITGNGAFHFDRNAAFAPPSNGYYTMVSYREVSY